MKSAITFGIVVFLLVIGIIVLGFAGSSYVADQITAAQHQEQLIEAKQAAILVSASDIASLSGSDADLSNPVYQRIKASLVSFKHTNPDILYVYVTGYRLDDRTNRRFFYVDSEPVTSPTYASPGLGFKTTDEEGSVQKYLAGQSYIDGPYQGASGPWNGAYVPIKSAGGAVVAMMGVDMPVSVSHKLMSAARAAVTIITILTALLVVAIAGAIFRKKRIAAALATEPEVPARPPLKYLEQVADLGTFIIDFPEESVTLDPKFEPLFKKTALTKEAFTTYIHMEDQEKYEDMLKDARTSNIVYSWVDVRIGTAELGFRKYHIYGNIERQASGAAARFDGVMQDITDGN